MLVVCVCWQVWWQVCQFVVDMYWMMQCNVYIVFMLVGFVFCGMLGVLLLVSINEQFSLGYVFIFVLIGVGLVFMYMMYVNLCGLQMDLCVLEGVYVGDEYMLELCLYNSGSVCFGIVVSVQFDVGVIEFVWVDVLVLGYVVFKLCLLVVVCGLRELLWFVIMMCFLFGFFCVWSYWWLVSCVWIYLWFEFVLVFFFIQFEVGVGEVVLM